MGGGGGVGSRIRFTTLFKHMKTNLSSTIKPYEINCISFTLLVPLICILWKFTVANKGPFLNTDRRAWGLSLTSMGIIEPFPLIIDECLSYDLGQHENLLFVSHYVSCEGSFESSPLTFTK